MQFRLRPARSDDARSIRELVLRVRINPLGLAWPNFVVAVLPTGEMIGCGQIKTHRDRSRELASIAVQPEWRKQGVASAIIANLISTSQGPLYLTCRSELGPFYERFGFREAVADELPPYFRRLRALAAGLSVLRLMHSGLLVMIRPA